MCVGLCSDSSRTTEFQRPQYKPPTDAGNPDETGSLASGTLHFWPPMTPPDPSPDHSPPSRGLAGHALPEPQESRTELTRRESDCGFERRPRVSRVLALTALASRPGHKRLTLVLQGVSLRGAISPRTLLYQRGALLSLHDFRPGHILLRHSMPRHSLPRCVKQSHAVCCATGEKEGGPQKGASQTNHVASIPSAERQIHALNPVFPTRSHLGS